MAFPRSDSTPSGGGSATVYEKYTASTRAAPSLTNGGQNLLVWTGTTRRNGGGTQIIVGTWTITNYSTTITIPTDGVYSVNVYAYTEVSTGKCTIELLRGTGNVILASCINSATTYTGVLNQFPAQLNATISFNANETIMIGFRTTVAFNPIYLEIYRLG